MCAVGEIASLTSLYCMILSYTVAASKINTPAIMQFSRVPVSYGQLRTFIGVSVAKCREECDRRARCKGVVYNRRTTQCILASHLQQDAQQPPDATTTWGGTQTVHGNDGAGLVDEGTVKDDREKIRDERGAIWIIGLNTGGAVMCGQKKCAEHCIDEDGAPVCAITECGELSIHKSAFTVLQGNMYYVKNKLVLRSSGDMSFAKMMTCGNDGHWGWNSQDTSMDYCHDFADTTQASSGLYMLDPSLQVVYCDMDTDGGHWLVFQRRIDGSVDFYLDWDDYVAGFGTLAGEFWLGLDALYTILQSGEFELRVDLGDFSDEHRYAQYSSFRLEGPGDNYRLWVSGYTGDAGDSLMSYHNGNAFTTKDADHDTISWYNCAERYEGAWWYSMCHKSNLNGRYFPDGQNTTEFANHIHWYNWHGYFYSLKTTEMKIRRTRRN